MTTPVETVRDPLNKVKWLLAMVLLASATVLGRYLPELSSIMRLLMVLGLGAVALALVFTTSQGRSFIDLLRQAQVEVRKVVWPTRPETTQTTLIVLVVVLVMSLLLWGMDSLFGLAISAVIG
jgi:preprotein translocase subunit SecE